MERTEKKEILLKGIPIMPGICIGKAQVLNPSIKTPVTRKISESQVEKEEKRFLKAIERLKKELQEIRGDLDERLSDLIDSQIMILEDPSFRERVSQRISRYMESAESAVYRILNDISRELGEKGSGYMRERSQELLQLARELITTMQRERNHETTFRKDSILLAEDLSIQDAIKAVKSGVRAIALTGGGKTSHHAIILRDFGIPAVFGMRADLDDVEDGTTVILDGAKGIVIVNPKKATLERYQAERERYEEFTKELFEHKEERPITLDGREFTVLANIDFPEELGILRGLGQHGIGLFRTEILYFTGKIDLESQREIYEKIAEEIYPCPFVIRAFDLGGDKVFQFKEKNPFLGVRGIRVLLRNKRLFMEQIKAVILANKKGNIKFMIPMVSVVEEVLESKELLHQVFDELKPREPGVQLPDFGIMIETPSSALIADKIAPHVDFFSIGTNDLTQYTLAVDRRNPEMSYLFDHLHPSVLRLIKEIVEVSHKYNVWVGVCGELAADPYGVPFLVGMGVDELSVPPASLLGTKELIRKISLEELEELVRKSLEAQTSREVRELAADYLRERYPEVTLFYPF